MIPLLLHKSLSKPLVAFSGDNTSGCTPLNVKIPANQSHQKTQGGTSTLWISNGLVNKSTKRHNTGFQLHFTDSKTYDSLYQVKLVGYSEHGCKDSVTKSIVVFPQT
jgi:hypothetical protein